MIIGLSGPQGAGKTTLLEGLKLAGFKVDDFKVSRSVQAQLGWDSLDRVKEDPYKMMEFQNQILAQKCSYDLGLLSKEVIFTERTFADVFAYTKDWTEGFVKSGELEIKAGLNFLNEYRAKCAHAQLNCYDALIFLPYMEHIVFEDDPHRAKFDKVQDIQLSIQEFLKDTKKEYHPQLTITKSSVQDRVNQVIEFAKLTLKN